MSKRWLTLVSIVLVVCIMVAWWAFGREGVEVERQKVAVRLLWLHQAQFAGIYTALREGFYDDRGLDVSLVPGGPGINPVRMVASGSEDIGVASGTDIVLAREKGIPVRSVAIVVPENPTCFFSKDGSGIKTVKDFAGKKVGVKVGFELEYYLTAMLKNAGVPESSIRRVPIQFDLTPFFNGEVDVWCGYRINEPNIARAQGVGVHEILPSDYGVNVVGDVIFASERFLDQQPEVVSAFVDATWEGWRFAKQNPEKAVQYTLEFNPKGDPQHEMAMLRSALPMIVKNGRRGLDDQAEDVWKEMVNFLRENGVIKATVEPGTCFWRRGV